MLKLDYQNLNFYNPVGNKIYCKSFVLNDEKCTELGSLFLTVSIGGGIDKGSKIADILQEVSRLEYFNSTPDKKEDPIKNFENTINKINQTFTTLIESNHIEWLDNLNLAIASVYKNNIQLVCTGDIKIYLFRENSLMSLNNNKDKLKPSPTKIFADIVSGTIQEKDKLFFSTKELLDYFTEDNIKSIVTKNSPKEASFQLQTALSKSLGNVNPIASIFIEARPEFEKSVEEKLNLPKIDSMSNLDELETLDKKKNTIEDIRENPKAILEIIKNYSIAIVTNLRKITSNLLIKLNLLKEKPKAVSLNQERQDNNYATSYKNKYTPKPSNIPDKILYYFQIIFKKYQGLPLTSKIFSITSVVFALAFLASIGFQADNKSDVEQNNFVTEQLLKATENEKLAADALIYSDFDKAKKLLFEAKEIITSKEIENSESNETKKEKEELTKKIAAHFDKIDKIIRIEDPLLVVDTPNSMEANRILGIDNSLYTYNPKDNSIYQIEESSKKLGTLFENSTNLGSFNKSNSNSAKNSLIFITNSSQAVEFNIGSKEIEEVDIAFSKSDQEITDLVLYNDRLYILDSKNNQIYKHTRTISGYSKGLTWVKEGEFDLSNAISITIDGEIYILNKDGGIIKFLNGYFKDFSLQQPSNSATSPTKVFTKIDYKYLYILDPQNNRLLVFNKQTGEFINQYISENFTDMQDIYVDETNKKIFLLCGSKIYGVVLENIEE
jgi:serine/threonine protein phosphatase PrpC